MTGKWSSPTPTCKETTCSKPILPKYGIMKVPDLYKNKIGSVTTYSCLDGYEIRNQSKTVG